MPAVVIRQRKAWRRRDGLFLYFEVRPRFRFPRKRLICVICLVG